jgi:hypothetical protein
LKKRSQVRTSEGGVCGEVAGAEEACRRLSAVVGVERKVDGVARVVVDIDVLEGCLVLSHGLSAVLKADLEGLERWETRDMDVRGLSRMG